MEKRIVADMPYDSQDYETMGWEYTIPEDCTAEIKDGKIIVKKKEPEKSKFEKTVEHVLNTVGMLGKPDKEYIKEVTQDILEAAKKEFETEDKDIKERIRDAWCEGNNVGYDDGKADAYMGMPKWSKATTLMESDGLDYLVLRFEKGPYSDDAMEMVVPSDFVNEGEYYMYPNELKRLPKEK